MYLANGTLLQGGKFKVISPIGSGGFGKTYIGYDIGLERQVVIKEFFVKDFNARVDNTSFVTTVFSDKELLIQHLKHKFLAEARIIAKMEHESIVKVHALFEENGTAYYVMDYIEGESVADILKRQGSIPENEAVPIILKTADALAYMHSQGCYHLDVKPSNIMIRRDGKVVLIDFGSSKQYAEVCGEDTTTSTPCFTSGYAPIEQMNFSKYTKYNAATDIYALGATFYKMLTGVRPPSSVDILNGDCKLPPLPSEISTEVQECIMKSMLPQRMERLQNIDDFLKVLQSQNKNTKTDEQMDNDDTRFIVPQKINENNKVQKEQESGSKGKFLATSVRVIIAVIAWGVGAIVSIMVFIAVMNKRFHFIEKYKEHQLPTFIIEQKKQRQQEMLDKWLQKDNTNSSNSQVTPRELPYCIVPQKENPQVKLPLVPKKDRSTLDVN